MSKIEKTAKVYDVFFLGFCLIVSGMPSMWNIGLGYGFWEFFICAVIMAVGYICLSSCVAEMTSILPFSGGSYGFARVTVGPFLGFVIGCFDSISNIYYGLMLVQYVCMSISQFVGDAIPPRTEPLQWLIMYVFCLSIQIGLGRWSFTWLTILGILLLCTCLAFIFSTAHQQDFNKYVLAEEDASVLFQGNMANFMKCLPIAQWLYLGPDMISLVCDDTENAKHVVPRTIVFTTVVSILVILSMIVSAAAQSPGYLELSTLAFPLSPGFRSAFGVSEKVVSIFMLPISFSGLFSLMYVYGRQMHAMARSKLLPYTFTFTTKSNVPYISLIGGTMIGYCVLLVTYACIPDYMSVLNQVYFGSLMCTISVYLVSCMCFIVFRIRYSSLERHYVNSFGIPSALLAMCIFGTSYVACAAYSTLAVKVYFGFVGFISVYYYLLARRAQTFSPEEKAVLFTAYVLKANSQHRTIYNWMRRVYKRVGSTQITCASEPEVKDNNNNNNQNNYKEKDENSARQKSSSIKYFRFESSAPTNIIGMGYSNSRSNPVDNDCKPESDDLKVFDLESEYDYTTLDGADSGEIGKLKETWVVFKEDFVHLTLTSTKKGVVLPISVEN